MKQSKPPMTPALELAEKLRSTARRGSMLRLPPPLVAVLMNERIYEQISALEAEEIRRTCRAATANDNATSSVTSGCGSGPTVEPGASAGSNIVPLEAMSRGARQQLSEAMSDLQRRKKH